MRTSLPKILEQLMENDPRYVLLIGDIGHYLFNNIEKKYPNRFYNIGICEQAMMSVASGLSLDGLIPIVYSIAPFVTERCYEQIKLGFGYQKTGGIIISVGGSFDYAGLGATHHCISDIGLMRLIDNTDIIVPGCADDLTLLIKKADLNRLTYIKLTEKQHTLKIKEYDYYTPYHINKLPNSKGVIFTTGHLLDEVMSQNSNKYDIVFVPVISEKTTFNNIKHLFQKEITTIEENNVIGGLGDFISHVSGKVVKKIGIPNKIIQSYGTAKEVREHLGLTKQGLKL